MSFKFKLGDIVLHKSAVVQQAINKTTIAKTALVTGLMTVERRDGVRRYYEVNNDSEAIVAECEITGIDGYNSNFTPEEAIEFINRDV